MELLYSLLELPKVAGTVWELLKNEKSRTIALHGKMGAGKTTFVTALLKQMGSPDAGSSPTFSIINQYVDRDGHPVYHMDWYRLEGEEEIIQAGCEDVLYSGHWSLVEWSEKAPDLLPEDTRHIFLLWEGLETRKLILAHHDGNG
jgi:tRNA threonylcarbamoyladenosine biosynthesis protein TsaE